MNDMIDLTTLTIATARAQLDSKEITAEELTKACLHAIEKGDTEIHAFLEVFDDALTAARAADVRIEQGDIMPLTGIPIAIKDNMLSEGHTASAGSKILKSYSAPYDATVVTRLKEQGAVIIGRTNMDEFAMGSSTESSAFGVTRNPVDTTRVPGGSSGGSAAAVSAGFVLGAYGTDTGGSIRQPASFCGVVGYKPTYGAVSRYGIIALGSSLDQVGSFGKTIEDAEILFEAVRGKDSNDATSLPARMFTQASTSMPLRVGVPREFLETGVDDDVRTQFLSDIEVMKKAGFIIQDVELPHLAYALPAYYIVMPAEASTNLARYDGIRYGLSLKGNSLEQDYAKTRKEGFGSEVQRRILIGTYVLSAGYFDAYYNKAMAVRELIRKDFKEAFTDIDIIATPTAPTPAYQIGEIHDPVAMYAGDVFTVPVNLAGLPAVSVPSGIVDRDGSELPLGLQLIGAYGADATVFAAAKQYTAL